MSMELTIQPFDTAAVVFNKAELAAAVNAITERYAGLVVTDKAEAKKDRADVNRILKQIDDVRKTVKKQYEAPLKQFEVDIKEVVEPLKAAGAAIDAQIKTIEETERNERKAVLEAVYADVKPVVRCKDCVSYREENALRYCLLYDFTVSKDFYCADFCPNCGAEMKGGKYESA